MNGTIFCVSLVKNIGVIVYLPTGLINMAQESIKFIIGVNVFSTNTMTAMFIPLMMSTGRNIDLCLFSGDNGISPALLLAAYTSTKAYNDAFSVALSGKI